MPRQVPQLKVSDWLVPATHEPPPLHAPHALQLFQAQLLLQLREWVCEPWLQLPHACEPVCGASVGAQTPPLVQPPQVPQVVHAQLELQLRKRERVPRSQLPQGASWLSEGAATGSQPLAPAQPPHVPQLPHEQSCWQVRSRFLLPELQLPQGCVSESAALGAQPGTVLQAPQSLQVSQAQLSLHFLERFRSWPQVPQPCGSSSLSPAMHSPSPLHRSSSHWQLSRQVRVALPQSPQLPRSSFCPGLHTPSPEQVPMSCHWPFGSQCCACMPHCPHFTWRSSPAVHEQSLGASHSPHAPITHC